MLNFVLLLIQIHSLSDNDNGEFKFVDEFIGSWTIEFDVMRIGFLSSCRIIFSRICVIISLNSSSLSISVSLAFNTASICKIFTAIHQELLQLSNAKNLQEFWFLKPDHLHNKKAALLIQKSGQVQHEETPIFSDFHLWLNPSKPIPISTTKIIKLVNQWMRIMNTDIWAINVIWPLLVHFYQITMSWFHFHQCWSHCEQ